LEATRRRGVLVRRGERERKREREKREREGQGMRPMGVSTKGDSGTSPMPCWKRRGGEEF
jgi:hypothetical protein